MIGRGRTYRAGFTLIELLISLTILCVIAAIIYASFSTVINTVDVTRVDAEELRLRQFLVRSFTTNVASVYSDPTYEQDVFALIGTDDGDENDSLRFVSSSPLLGGTALPGDLKEVTYEVVNGSEEEGGRVLECVETPLLGANVQEVDEQLGRFVPDTNYESPSWSVPVRSLNIRYFDGVEWLDDWDSIDMGRMPWCIEVDVNFARTEDQLDMEKSEQIDPVDSPDLVLVLTVPIGAGTNEETATTTGDNSLLAQQKRLQDQQNQGTDGNQANNNNSNNGLKPNNNGPNNPSRNNPSNSRRGPSQSGR